MIYFYALDKEYYKRESIEKLQEKYNLTNIEICISQEQVNKQIHKFYSEDNNFTSIISPLSLEYMKLHEEDFIDEIILNNTEGLRTSQQVKFGISEKDVLKRRLFTEVQNPKVTLDDYRGGEILKKQIEKFKLKQLFNETIKGFFLTGVPGTGKSYFAKCVSGELDRHLVTLDLSSYIGKPRTIDRLGQFFNFFKTNQGKFVIWIDEIDKQLVLGGEKETIVRNVVGFLLKEINDLAESENVADVFFVITSNNLTQLKITFPELFRSGRFDWKLRLETPKRGESAKDVYEYYLDKQKKRREEYIYTLFYNVVNESENIKKIEELENKDAAAIVILDILKDNDSYLKGLNDLNKESSSQKEFFRKVSERINNDDYLITNLFNEINEQCKFEIELSVIETVSETWANKYLDQGDHLSSLLTDNSSYTQAEIEFLFGEIFDCYFFVNKEIGFLTKDKDLAETKTKNMFTPAYKLLHDLIEKSTPIVVTDKDSLQEMISSTQNWQAVN